MSDPLSVFVDPETNSPFLNALKNIHLSDGERISPQAEGQAYDAGKQLGIPTSVFRDSDEPFDFESLTNAARRRTLLQNNKDVATWMAQSLSRAHVAKNDVPNLINVFRLISHYDRKRTNEPRFSEIARMSAGEFLSAPGQFALGIASFLSRGSARILEFAGLQTMSGFYDSVAEELEQVGQISRQLGFRALPGSFVQARERGAKIREDAPKLPFGNVGFIEIAGGAGSILPIIATGGLAGLFTRGAVEATKKLVARRAVIAASGLQSFGPTYLESREDGESFAVASGKASVSGLITSLVTALSMRLFGPLGVERFISSIGRSSNPKAFTKSFFVTAVGKNATEEFLEEGIDEFIQGVVVDGLDLGSAISRAFDAATIGAILGATFGGSVEIYSRRRNVAANAIDTHDRLETMLNAVADSDTGKASKEMGVELMQEGMRSSVVGFVDPEIVIDIVEANPEAAAQLESIGLSVEDAKILSGQDGNAGGGLMRVNTPSLVKLDPEIRAQILDNWHSTIDAPSKLQAERTLGERSIEARLAANDDNVVNKELRDFSVATARLVDQIVKSSDTTPELAGTVLQFYVQAAFAKADRNDSLAEGTSLLQRIIIRAADGPITDLGEARALLEGLVLPEAGVAPEPAPEPEPETVVEPTELMAAVETEEAAQGLEDFVADAQDEVIPEEVKPEPVVELEPDDEPVPEFEAIEASTEGRAPNLIVGINELGPSTGNIEKNFKQKDNFYEGDPDSFPMGEQLTLFQRSAWHGGAVNFLRSLNPAERRFLVKFIGTGEGNLAFGWGLYFTSPESIGRWYANAMAIKYGDVLIGEQNLRLVTEIDGEPVSTEVRNIVNDAFRAHDGDFDEMIESSTELLNQQRQLPQTFTEKDKERNAEVHKFLLDLRADFGTDTFLAPLERVLFRVDLWRNQEEVLLDWDTRIGDQRAILAAVRKAIPEEAIAKFERKIGESILEWTGENAYESLESQAKTEPLPGEEYAFLKPGYRSDRAASLYLLREGVDGIQFIPARQDPTQDFGENARNFVVFDDSFVDIVENQLYQSRANEQTPMDSEPLRRGSLFIHDNLYLISLFPDQDLSTILHEGWHIFLNEMRLDIESGSLNEQLIEDWRILNDWFEENGLPRWEDMQSQVGDSDSVLQKKRDQREAAHELVAENGEFYFATAEAPSAELEQPFSRFRNWITSIYGDIESLQDRGRMTEQVRGVFDRLLATKRQIDDLVIINEMMGRGTNELDDKMDLVGPKTRSRYNRIWREMRDRVRDTLWTARVKATAVSVKAQRKIFTEDVNSEPVYRAWQVIKANGGLNWEALNGSFGVESIRDLRRVGRLVAKKDEVGIRPEEVANESGFENADDAISELRETNSPTNEVERRLNDWRLEQDNLIDPMEAVIQSPEYQKAIEMMGRMLSSSLRRGTPRLQRKAIKKLAQAAIEDLPGGMTDAVRVDVLLQEMDNERNFERRAVMRDEFEAALQHNHNTQVRLEMVKIAIRLKKQRAALIRRSQRLAKRKKGSIDWAHHYHGVKLAERHGLITPRRSEWPRPVHLEGDRKGKLVKLEDIVEGNVHGQGMLDHLPETPDWLIDEGNLTPLNQMTVEEFLQIERLMKLIETRGTKIAEERQEMNDIAEEAVGHMVTLKDQLPVPFGGVDSTFGKWVDKIGNGIRGGLSQMTPMHRGQDAFGGGVRVKDIDLTRPMMREVELPALAAEENYLTIMGDMAEQLRPHVNQLRITAKRLGRWPDVRDQDGVLLKNPAKRGKRLSRGRYTNMDLIGMALYMGNDYTRNAVAEGLGFVDEKGNPDLTVVDQLVSVFTNKDWDAFVGIWDALDTMWPAQVEAYTRMYGSPPTKVDGDDFFVTTADGQMREVRGGYFPLRFDNRVDKRQAQQDEIQNQKDIFGGIFVSAVAPTNHLKERKSTGGKPVLLSPQQVLGEHLEFASRFISHGEFVQRISKLFSNSAYQDITRDKFGTRLANEQLRWLRSLVIREYEHLDGFDLLVEAWRPLSALYVLGGKLSSAITQTEAIMSLSADIGWNNYHREVQKLVKDPSAMIERWNLMNEVTVMKDRLLGAGDRELRDLLQGFDFSPLTDKIQSLIPSETIRNVDAKNIMNKIQRWSLSPVLAPSIAFEFFAWSAMYEQRLVETGGDIEAAKLFATFAVLSTSPSNLVKDLGSAQRSKKGAFRLMTMLMTATIRRMGSNAFIYRAMREGKVGLGEGMAFIGMSWFGAAILPGIITFGLWELGDDDEGEDLTDKMSRFLGMSTERVFLYQIQGIPMNFEIVRWVQDILEEGEATPANFIRGLERQPIGKGAKITSMFIAAVLTLPFNLGSDDKEERDAAFWAIFDAASFYLGIPVSRVVEDFQKGVKQMEKGAGPFTVIQREPPDNR